MRNLLSLLFTTLFFSVTAQQTYYTTGLGEGNWDDPQSWTLLADESGPAGPPQAQDHVVIRHTLTHFTDQTYTHQGNVRIESTGSYEIVSGLETEGTYTFAGQEFDVHGNFVIAGHFVHQEDQTHEVGTMILRATSTAYFTRELVLQGAAKLIIQSTSCGAVQAYGDLQVKSTDVSICGPGHFIVSGQLRAWDVNGAEILESAQVRRQLEQQVCTDFPFYASAEACAEQSVALVGQLALQPEVEIFNLAAKRQADLIEISWEAQEEEWLEAYTLERSVNGQAYKAIAQIPVQQQTDETQSYTAIDEQPRSGQVSYRLRQQDLLGREIVSDPISLVAFTEMRLYPNPSTQAFVNLEASGFAPNTELELLITNLMGQSLIRQSLQVDGGGQLQQRYAHKLPAGTYLVQLRGVAHQHSERLMVQE